MLSKVASTTFGRHAAEFRDRIIRSRKFIDSIPTGASLAELLANLKERQPQYRDWDDIALIELLVSSQLLAVIANELLPLTDESLEHVRKELILAFRKNSSQGLSRPEE